MAALLRAVPGVLLRLSLGVLAMLLMLGALLVAAVLTIGLLTWALLRGRRLAPGAFSATFQRSRGGGHAAAAAGAVIDVEARVMSERDGAAVTTRRMECRMVERIRHARPAPLGFSAPRTEDQTALPETSG